MKKDLTIDCLKLFSAFTIMSAAIGLIVLLSKIFFVSENIYIQLGYFPAIGVLFGVALLSLVYAAGKILDITDRMS